MANFSNDLKFSRNLYEVAEAFDFMFHVFIFSGMEVPFDLIQKASVCYSMLKQCLKKLHMVHM